MNIEAFQTFATEAGLKPVGESAYGMIGKFPVKVQLQGKRMYVIFTLPKGEPKRLRAAADNALGGIGVSQVVGPENLAVLPYLKEGEIKSGYDNLAKAMLEFFREYEVEPVTDCPFCDEPGYDCTVAHQLGSQYAHFSCVSRQHIQTVGKVIQDQRTGRYLTGVLGGVLGGLLACIPSFLSMWFFSRIFAILYVLIPLGVYYGYKYGKGKSDKVAVMTTVVLSLVYAFMIEWMMLAFMMVALGRPLSWIGDFLSQNMSLLMGDILFSLCFVGIGIAFTWRQISRTLESEVTDTSMVMETFLSTEELPGEAGADQGF